MLSVASVSNGKSTPSKTRAHTPTSVVLHKLLECVICGFFTVVVLPKFPITHLKDSEFKQAHFLYRMFYVILCTSVTRQRYYLAWKLAEAGNISSGFGFNGYSISGHSKWDLLDNAHVMKVEFANNLKVLLDHWNIRTSHWLRYVVYERVHSTLAVFVFSAFWHGFYGGYYISFMTAALFISAGRHVRRNIRPFFQQGASLSMLYDIITVIGTQIMLAYLTFPFVLLEFWLSVEILWGMYFWLHVTTVGIVILFTFIKLQPPKTDERNIK
ncbi:Lysophospholipid acyltransferase 1 [Lamellibrachia satsuma]|nr:Lysophospholipid acyltransferase 1 [Lamellibrachia satsuma]